MAQFKQKSLDQTEMSLQAMRDRTECILAVSQFTSEDMVELLVILDNVGYIFLFLEANNEYVTYEQLAPLKKYFRENSELEAKLLRRLCKLECATSSEERSRETFIAFLNKRNYARESGNWRAFAAVEEQAAALNRAVDRDRQLLLSRLGIEVSTEKTVAAYHSLIGRVGDSDTRRKLSITWRTATSSYNAARAHVVDDIANLQWQEAIEQGANNSLEATLARTSLSESEVIDFLQLCLTESLDDQHIIAEELGRIYGDMDPTIHFRHFIKSLAGDRPLPLFDLDECLAFAYAFCRAVFELDFQIISISGAPLIEAVVLRANQQVGAITFDLWNVGDRKLAMNQTIGLRNRTDWGRFRQLPEAHVACKFDLTSSGTKQITFQNLHSLFHELGHAVNHLLIQQRIPNQSGLEYLPLERLECLSMWFEKWVYHCDFSAFLTCSDLTSAGLDTCRDIRRLEYRQSLLERCVIAHIDLQIHGSERRSFQSCMDELEEEYGISRYVAFTDLPSYFFLPMARVNPGASFIYLWGAAWSCEKYATFRDRSLTDITATHNSAACFESCFNSDSTSSEPNARVLRAFYA